MDRKNVTQKKKKNKENMDELALGELEIGID